MEPLESSLQSVLRENLLADIEKMETSARKTALFVLGPPGAGKTSYIGTHLTQCLHVRVPTDDYFDMLYEEGDDVNEVYSQARAIAVDVTDSLLARGVSMMMEGTGSHPDIIDFMKRLSEAGYSIVTIFLPAELPLCVARVMARNETSKRHMSIETVIACHEGFTALRDAIDTASDSTFEVPPSK